MFLVFFTTWPGSSSDVTCWVCLRLAFSHFQLFAIFFRVMALQLWLECLGWWPVPYRRLCSCKTCKVPSTVPLDLHVPNCRTITHKFYLNQVTTFCANEPGNHQSCICTLHFCTQPCASVHGQSTFKLLILCQKMARILWAWFYKEKQTTGFSKTVGWYPLSFFYWCKSQFEGSS